MAGTVSGLCPVCLLDDSLGSDGHETAASFHYELVEEIARGGMGVVYRAIQHGSQRQVAVKMIAAEHAASSGITERFRAEVEAVASLDHPNILPIYETGETEGSPFYSMKFAEGGTLRDRLGHFREPRKAARLIARVARAVHHAHQRGILHRDLKPANILLDDAEETPYVADFGIAKWLHRDSALTLMPTALGTPHYMAPEQAAGASAQLTTAADIYSLGAILYELLAGRPPFVAETPLETLRLVTEAEPPALSEAPRDLEVICRKCLSKEPAARYASAAELAEDLDRWSEGKPITARRVRAPERVWRWARRHPLPASLVAGLLLLLVAVAIGSSLAARRLAEEKTRAVAAEQDATEKLRDSYLAQARASRRTGRAGQRFDSLSALGKAARIRPGIDLRNETIAALALTDLSIEKRWGVRKTANSPIAFDAALERYAVETTPGLVSIRRVTDASELAQLPAPEGAPRALFITPFTADGKWLAVRHADARLRVWDTSNQPRLAFELTNHPTAGTFPLFPFDCAFSPDGTRMASGAGEEVVLHELATGREIARLPTGSAPACLAFDPTGARLAVVGKLKEEVQIFDLKTGAVTLRLQHPKFVTPIAWTADGRSVATGCEDFNIYLWSAETGERRAVLAAHRQPPTQLLFDRSGQTLISTGRDKAIRVWNLRTGTQSVQLPAHGAEPVLRLAADGTRLACTTWNIDAIMLRLGESEVWRQIRGPGAGERAGMFAAVDFSPDARLLATASRTAVRLFDAATGEELASLSFDADAEKAALFQRDGEALVISSRASALSRLPIVRHADFRLSFGQPEVLDPAKSFLLNAISPDGQMAAISSRTAGETHLVSLGDPQRRVVLSGQSEVWHAGFSPDGRLVATSSSGHSRSTDEDVRIWNCTTGELIHRIDIGGGGVGLFNPNGTTFVANGTKGAVLLKSGDWEPAAELSKEIRDEGIVPTISPDGTLLSFSIGETIHLLRADTGEQIALLDAPSPISTIRPRFSPDSAQLALLGGDNVVQIWNMAELRRELGQLNLDWD